MPIQQTRFIHCASCGAVIKIESYGEMLTPFEVRKLFAAKKSSSSKPAGKLRVKNDFSLGSPS